MKKKLIAAAIAAALLVSAAGVALAAAGDAGDPFVTLNYLKSIFYTEVQQDMLTQAQQGTAETEKEAFDKLNTLAGSYLAQAGGGLYADTFVPIILARGDRLGLPAGASFQFEGGSCSVDLASGTLIDVTNGTTFSNKGTLTAGHRYVASDDTACTITAISDSVYVSMRGCYMLDASGMTYSPFTDMFGDEWYYPYTIYAYEYGLFSGTTATTFSPTTKMSRAMLATVLSRIDGQPVFAPSAGFSDVPDEQWFTNSVNWAAVNGIVTGGTDGTFRPNDNVTREQLCTMLYRYAKNYLGMDVSITADLSGFADHSKISPYAAEAVAWAVGNGIMTGTTPSTLSPNGTASRAEVATMLQRFCNQLY